MTITPLTPPAERIKLSGISWQTYETLLNELENHRRLRLTYNRGNLEIMAPSPEHELYKKVIGRFVETLAEELKIRIYPLGSTTFKRPEISGAEPDECFYINNIDGVKGKKRLGPEDPGPDLVVEIDITRRSDDRFDIYSNLGVPEVWIYDGKSFTIKQLQNQDYVVGNQSLYFPNLPLSEIAQFLEQAETMDYLELVKAFRSWVRSQISQ